MTERESQAVEAIQAWCEKAQEYSASADKVMLSAQRVYLTTLVLTSVWMIFAGFSIWINHRTAVLDRQVRHMAETLHCK